MVLSSNGNSCSEDIDYGNCESDDNDDGEAFPHQ